MGLQFQKTTWGSKKAHRRQPGFHRKKTLLFNNISGSITAPWSSDATELVTDADDMLLGRRAGAKAKGIQKEEHDTKKQKVCGTRERGQGDPGTPSPTGRPAQSTSAGLLSPREVLAQRAHVTARAPVSPAVPKSW